MHNNLKLLLLHVIFVASSLCAGNCNAQQLHNESFKLEFRIIFENDVVGHIYLEKKLLPNLQRTTETLELITQFRGINPLKTRIIEIHEEDNQGHPLRFSKQINIPNAEHQIHGEIEGSEINLRYTRGKNEIRLQRKIPDDFVLAEGLKQKIKAAAKENQTFTYSEWDYDAQEFITKKLNLFEEKKLTLCLANNSRISQHSKY